jgi:hypothetical protein
LAKVCVVMPGRVRIPLPYANGGVVQQPGAAFFW